MKNFIFLILGKIYTVAAVLLGIIILVKAGFLKLNIPYTGAIEVIVLIACLYSIPDIFHVIGDSEVETKWKIYGTLSNLFVLFAVLVIGAELLGIAVFQKIAEIEYFHIIVGILLILDNFIWFLVGE